MKKFKKLLSVMLMASMMAGLVACGGASSNQSAAPAAEPAKEEAPAAEAPAAEPAGEAAEPAGGDFVPADQILLPVGKTAYALPVDQVADKEIRIAAIALELNEFSLLVVDGVKWAQQVLADRNCTVDYQALTKFDAVALEELIRNCITMQYDAICTFGMSEDLQPVIQEAVDAGIIVCTWNTDAGEGSARTAFFGEDGYDGGSRIGKHARETMGEDGGKYAVITGSFSVYSHELRKKGFEDQLADNANFELIGEYENNDSLDEAYTLTENLIIGNPDIKAIYVTAGGPEGAAKAIADAGKTGEIMLFCHDWTSETVKYTKDGVIFGCVDQDPFNQGAAPIVCSFNQLMTGEQMQEINYFKGNILTPDNVYEYYPE